MRAAWASSGFAVPLAGLAAALCAGAIAGLAPAFAIVVPVALVSLLPILVHVRVVGLRRALTEPSAATIALIFYLFVFPLRGLAIALTGYGNVGVVRQAVGGEELIETLLLAGVGATALVGAFHVVASRRPGNRVASSVRAGRGSSVALAAGVMSGIALASISAYVYEKGGIAVVQAEQISHSKQLVLGGARSALLSLWAIVAVPAVWAASLVATDRESPAPLRAALIISAAAILCCQIVLFGSRLDLVLSLVGAWVVVFFSGRRVPVTRVLGAGLLLVALSVPILQQRPGEETARQSAIERYSAITGYSVLDAALAVRQEPHEVRAKLEDLSRWTDFPKYLVPSAVRPGGQVLETRRMDLYVARSLGTPAQRDTGFPTTYITEAWLYAGWPGVLAISLALGLGVGLCHRRLVGGPASGRSAANLFWYAFAVAVAFTYFKDGDILVTAVGATREAAYLGAILLACGVWKPLERRPAAAAGAYGQPLQGRG